MVLISKIVKEVRRCLKKSQFVSLKCEDDFQELFDLVIEGNFAQARERMMAYRNVNFKNSSKSTLLITTCQSTMNEKGILTFVQFLLQKGAYINKTDASGRTAIDYCEQNGLLQVKSEIYKQRRTMEEKIIIETNVNVGINRQPTVNAMTMWKDSNINESYIVSTSWELLASKMDTTTLKGLLCEKDYTDDWPLGRIQDKVFQVAFFWICILDYVDSDPQLTYKYHVQNCIENVHLHCSNVSAFVRKIKNLKEKVQKKKQKELLYNSVLEVTKIEELGVECKKQGITEKWLLNPEEINVGFLSRKLIFELRHYKRRNNITDKTCGLWIKHICKLESIPHLGSLWLNIDRMFNKKTNMKLEERVNFLNGAYQPPLTPKEVDPNIELHCRECCKQAQVNKITYNKVKGKVGNENKVTNLKKEKYEAQFQVYKLNKEKRTLSQKLDKCQQKLGSLSMRNVNKRINRRNNKIQTLMEENKKLKNQKQHLHALTRKIRLKYKQRAAMLKYYNNKVNNFKNKQVNKVISRNIEQKNEGKQMLEENLNLKQQVYFLENENEEIKLETYEK
ncbi:unnamed protein product [Mytilus edulis]|uniref:Uncharacterized protein n=1 Tax=Mytilus edulis TaxID=6550 RepID=A0A8S3T0T2_MYTED|nr:unnamed protein product [Mytilus edulis]